MGQWIEGNRDSLLTGADLSTSQYLIGKFDSNGNVVTASATTDKFLGIIDIVTATGSLAPVTLRLLNSGGSFGVQAGGTVSRGDLLTTNSSGQAVTASSGNFIIGMAMEASTAADQIIEVLLYKGTA